MTLLALYKALEVTLKNETKFETCRLGAKDTNIKVLIILFCFQISLFPSSVVQTTTTSFPTRVLNMNFQNDQIFETLILGVDITTIKLYIMFMVMVIYIWYIVCFDFFKCFLTCSFGRIV